MPKERITSRRRSIPASGGQSFGSARRSRCQSTSSGRGGPAFTRCACVHADQAAGKREGVDLGRPDHHDLDGRRLTCSRTERRGDRGHKAVCDPRDRGPDPRYPDLAHLGADLLTHQGRHHLVQPARHILSRPGRWKEDSLNGQRQDGQEREPAKQEPDLSSGSAVQRPSGGLFTQRLGSRRASALGP